MAGRNVLIFHSGALGDFVLTWPLVLGVARTMPQCRVIVVAGADKGELAEKVLRVESRDAEAGWPTLFGNGRLPEKPAKLLAGARLVLSFVADTGSAWEANVRRHTPEADVLCLQPVPPHEELSRRRGGSRGSGADRTAPDPATSVAASGATSAISSLHATDFLLEQLRSEPVLHAGTAGMVESIRKTGLMPRAFDPAGPLVVHPGSGSPAKNWPADRWLDWIGRQARPVRVVVGEVEREHLPADTLARFAEAAELVQPADLPGLVDALTGVRGFVGHDTGPTHLAASLGLPTLALFGPTDPAVWSPQGPRVTVLRREPLSSLDPDDVAFPSD